MKSKLLPYEKERLIMLSLGILLILGSLSFIGYLISTNYLSTFTKESLTSLTSNIAIFAIVFFMISFSLFIIRTLLKNLMLKEKNNKLLKGKSLPKIKKFLILSSKILQKIHVITALIGLSAILIHFYIGIYLGFNLTAKYILGIVALLSIILTCILGVIKIFNKKFYFHRFLAIIFIVVFILHILV